MAIGVTGVATLALINGLGLHRRQAAGSHTLAGYASMLSFQASLLILAILCSRLHRRLLEPPASPDRTLA